MTAEELDQRLAALPQHQPKPPPPAPTSPFRDALRGLIPEAQPANQRQDEDVRRERIRELLAARKELEARIRNPKLLARLRKLDTRCAVLIGPTGAGKTSAARWAQLRHRGLWVSARVLGACERKHPLGEGDPPLMRDAVTTPVLYLDDLGAEEPRDVSVIQHVIDQRYTASRATFVTSALTQDALQAHFGSPYVRRLAEQHVRRSDGSEWPVLFVDCHEAAP